MLSSNCRNVKLYSSISATLVKKYAKLSQPEFQYWFRRGGGGGGVRDILKKDAEGT
jgi:hypothetical protein